MGIIIEEISSNSLQEYNFYSTFWSSVHCLSCALGCLISVCLKPYIYIFINIILIINIKFLFHVYE